LFMKFLQFIQHINDLYEFLYGWMTCIGGIMVSVLSLSRYNLFHGQFLHNFNFDNWVPFWQFSAISVFNFWQFSVTSGLDLDGDMYWSA
jgi:hypothetical protein